MLRTGSARPIVGELSVASRRCLPSRDSSGSSTGYSPVKQAVHSAKRCWPVDSIGSKRRTEAYDPCC